MMDNYDGARKIIRDPELLNYIYYGSTIMGKTASVFVKESIKENKYVMLADVGSKTFEAGCLIYQSFVLDRQFYKLSANSAVRHQKELELSQKIGELENERDTLQAVVQRTGWSKNGR
jgi:hypothetical protein